MENKDDSIIRLVRIRNKVSNQSRIIDAGDMQNTLGWLYRWGHRAWHLEYSRDGGATWKIAYTTRIK